MTEDERHVLEEKYEGSTENRAALRRDFARLATGEPLAYVIGWQPFLGLKIYLDSHPLIPRPETEWWVEELVRTMSKMSGPLRLLDLCAGSGAIGCAVLRSVNAGAISFGELTPEHEATIWKNIRENHLDESRADVRSGDLFAPFTGEKFNVIAANPPYIPEGRPLEGSVAQHEPKEALRAGEDGLSVIRRIAEDAPAHLLPGGELWMECDGEHAEAARALIAAHATRAELRTDQYGRPRLIVGYY